MTELMTPRAYLVSMGLAQPTRGRFSATARAELERAKKAGMDFKEESPKPARKAVSISVPKSQPKPKVDGSKYDLSAVRAWAKENGIAVADRGRVSSEVIQAYLDANKDAPIKVEQNPFGPGNTVIRPIEKYQGKDIDGKTIVLSNKDTCAGCRVSIMYCACATPTTWSRVDTTKTVDLHPGGK